MEGYIDLKSLTIDELTGVVNLYPWFGNARKELCVRMAKLGGEVSLGVLSEAALYVSSRKALREIIRNGNESDCSDKDAQKLLKSYIEQQESEQQEDTNRRKVFVVGGDYFSQSQYDSVRREDVGFFADKTAGAVGEAARTPRQGQPGWQGAGFWKNAGNESNAGTVGNDDSLAFYTETLAQIYAEQGYFEQAKRIYSKLILAYPEKNAYFAALIRKLEQNIKTV